jgi:hypothetical protein
MGNLMSTGNSYTKEELYTKNEIDNKIKSELEKMYTKTQVDDKLKVLSAIWCVDGKLCDIPNSSTGLKIGNYSIEKNEEKICLTSNLDTFCFDGKIIYKK